MIAVRIRKMKSSDHAEIIKIAKSLSQWFTKDGVRQIRYAIKRQPGLAAVEKSKVIGFLTYRTWKHTALMTWIGVSPEKRRKGIGAALVKGMEKIMKKKGVEKIQVSTLARTVRYKPYEETRKFYEKADFRLLRIDKGFYPQGGDREILVKKM